MTTILGGGKIDKLYHGVIFLFEVKLAVPILTNSKIGGTI